VSLFGYPPPTLAALEQPYLLPPSSPEDRTIQELGQQMRRVHLRLTRELDDLKDAEARSAPPVKPSRTVSPGDKVWLKYSDLEKQQKSESQEEQMMPFDEMKKIYLEKFDEYMSGEKKYNDFRNFMTLGFFLLEIPVRVQNYLKMKVKKGTENIEKLAKANNYLVINGDKMFFRWNNYKTKEKIGEKTYEIKDEKTKQLIKKYLEDYHPDGKKKQARKDFLLNESMNPISQPDFSNGLKQITNKLYDKSFSVNAIRHSFITQLMANDPSLEQKIEILNTMGQTYKPQQVDYYKKIDKDEPERDSQGMKKKEGEKV
jgi:hypothetical protein